MDAPAVARPAGGWRALLLAALLVSGCRRDPDGLTVAVALLPSELPEYRAALGGFERESGLRLSLVAQQYADIRRALAAEAFAGRGTLDLVELDVYALAASASYVCPIEPAELAPELDALDPQAVGSGTIDGLRFLPHRVGWQALLYDHAALGKPPADWDELVAVAQAHPGKIGFKAALYEGLTCDILPFVWAAGGSGDVLDDAGALAAFRLFAALAPDLHPQSASFKEPTAAEAMARGELVLHLDWPVVASLYASQGLSPNPIRSAPIPRGPHGRATVLGGGFIGVPCNAPHRAGAVRLVRHLLSRTTQETLARRLGWFSARHDVPLPDAEALAGFAAMRNDVRPRPRRTDYERLSRLWQQAFRAVVFDGVAPEVALRTAAARAAEITHQ